MTDGARIGRTRNDSTPWWPETPKAPDGAPNVLLVIFDDVGFSDFGCYGSFIRTTTIDKIVAEGLRYTGFHTTAMCSTTRAALLTGRNHHSVGVGCFANFDSGFPGYCGKIAKDAGTLAEMLRPHGYRNYMVGKCTSPRSAKVAQPVRSMAGPSAAASTATTASWTLKQTTTPRSSSAITRISTRPVTVLPATTSAKTSPISRFASKPSTKPSARMILGS